MFNLNIATMDLGYIAGIGLVYVKIVFRDGHQLEMCPPMNVRYTTAPSGFRWTKDDFDWLPGATVARGGYDV